MCSVFGCCSGRRNAQRYKLPEDPERRLEWVQFLATVNKQRFKESSWTDITICGEHFGDDCFENLTAGHSGMTGKVQLTLKPSAVPSLCLQSECDEPEPVVESPQCEVLVESTEVVCQRYKPKTCDGPSPVPRGVSAHTSEAFICVYGQMHPRNGNFNLIREKAALLHMKGKYIVNEKKLLQLFSPKCPLCGSKVKVKKVTKGLLVILNQQCTQCEYRSQWKNRVSASVPTAEDQHLTGWTDVTPQTPQAAPTDDGHSSIAAIPEIDAVIDEESELTDETEDSSDRSDMDSDDDWKPTSDFFPVRVLQSDTDDETENEEEENDDSPCLAPNHSQLCTECGKFFNKQKHHMCEHKIKPYSCNICGKRCVSEVALNFHNRVHNENYEHRCKYCHVTFKTKVDKINHEQIHITEGKPYKCPDCSETFATNKERVVHLEDHRGPRQLKCHICGIEFRSPPYLRRHLAVHTGVKPFKCSVCQRGFNQAGHLKSHMRLHTGERPYKCQHCDKCFNHNVSLKSHVQRYHTPSSGCEKIKERESDSGNAEGNGNTIGTDSEFDNVEEEHDTEEEVQKERTDPTKSKRRSTGRAIGRPKRNESGNLVLAAQVEGQCSNSKCEKQKEQKVKRKQCCDGDSEDEPSDSDTWFDSAEEEDEERSKKAKKSQPRTRARPKNSDCDSDFDPEGVKKNRNGSQNSGKSLGKRRGRPRRNLVV
uniref:zinc finger protein 184-like n=1 Tax=Scatophagus argus TaxID=75038 RepID=UPI001ED847CF|nr:zinc finger protein 184-like [Scatophagus argus]